MLNFVWFPKVLNNPIRRRRTLQVGSDGALLGCAAPGIRAPG